MTHDIEDLPGWFHGTLSRRDAEALLHSYGISKGPLLVLTVLARSTLLISVRGIHIPYRTLSGAREWYIIRIRSNSVHW